MVEKNPPLEAPLRMAKTVKGANDVDAGQRTTMVMAFSMRAKKRVFTEPMRSQKNPDTIRPTPDENVKAATRMALVLDERPNDLL